jgi:hypothetical protein
VLLKIELNETMAEELERVRRESNCSSLAQVATECVEVVLAERRLPQVTAGVYGARPPGKEVKPVEYTEPDGYAVRLEQVL